MAKNEERRRVLVDAGLTVLARSGGRGLTHRAIDREAGLPQGTCGNYLPSRDALFEAMGARIFERLTPSEEELGDSADEPPSRVRMVVLMQELMGRVLAQPELQLALLELRLESTRRPALEKSLRSTLQAALQVDLDFLEAANLPGGRRGVELLHLAIGGLILHTVTVPAELGLGDIDEVVADLVERIYR